MDPSGSGRDGPDLPPPPPEVEPSYDDNQNASGNGIKEDVFLGAPYFPNWTKDADTYVYEFEPVAPSKFPPTEDARGFEPVIPPEDIGDRPHLSIFGLLALIIFLGGAITVAVLSGLACNDSLGWCQTEDVSPGSNAYIFKSFPWLVPTEWILASVAVGLFGLVFVSAYGVMVIRNDCGTPRMVQIATYIRKGAISFLIAEFIPLILLVIGIMILLILLFQWRLGVCYVIGAGLSGLTGAVGMLIATKGNVRTTAASEQSLSRGLNVAFRSGAVMGLSVVSIGLTGLGVCYLAFSDVRALAGFSAGASTIALFARVGGGIYTKAADVGADLVGKVEASIPEDDPRNPATIADNVGDNVGDVAGMGADLFESFVGSIIATAILGASLPYFFENKFALCVYNHLNIDLTCGSQAPNGSGATSAVNPSYANQICLDGNLFEQYPSLTRLSSQSLFVLLPFTLAMVGIGASTLCTVYLYVPGGEVKDKSDVMKKLLWSLRINTWLAGVLITAAAFGLTYGLFGPSSDFLTHRGFGQGDLDYYHLQMGPSQCQPRLDKPNLPNGDLRQGFFRPYDPIGFQFPPPTSVWWRLYLCIIIGLLLGIAIGELTEFFTSGSASPTKGIAASGEYGAGAVVIQGLGIGLLSVVAPLLLVFGTIIGTYALFSSYGIALAAVGMLSSLGITMATDAYGPVADNAGGIAEMAELPSHVRDTTDALDALGNTTAAVGKGFSNGSAVLTAYALLTALIQDSGLMPGPEALVGNPADGAIPRSFAYDTDVIDLVNVYVITSLLLGIMLPFLFGAFTMLAVSRAAQAMIVEVRRQFREIPGLREGRAGVRPDHERCIRISTIYSLAEMFLPGMVAIMSPLIIGFGFGQRALVGLLLGAIGSGYMLGIMMSNAGGAWDNAKKLVESGYFGKANSKGSEWHKATVAGDTVGDPFKDTSGPSMNILIKMMTVFGLVFVPKMKVELTDGWIGLVLLGATALIGVLFYLVYSRRTNKMREEARRVQPAPTDEPLVAPAAQSPYIAPGPGFNVSGMPRQSALYDAYQTAGGQSGAVAGNTVDIFNLPGLGYGTKDPMHAPEVADEPDIARAKGPQFDPRTLGNEESKNAPPPPAVNKKDD